MGHGNRTGTTGGPTNILQRISELERFLQGAANGQLALGAVERESEGRGRELVRLLLQAHLDPRGDGDVGDAILAGSRRTGVARSTLIS